MAHEGGAAAGGPAPAEVLIQVATAYIVPQALYAATALGIPDLVAAAPMQYEELARRTGTNSRALSRLLRALCSVGIFVESQGEIGATPLSRCLTRDAPDSVRATVLVAGAEQYQAWGDLLHTIKTGVPAFEHRFGSRWYEYLRSHQQTSDLFDTSMRETGGPQWDLVVGSYDFTDAHTIVDVGGGHGALLASVLRAYPGAHGVLYDLEDVVAGAEEYLGRAGVADRCRVESGSFFNRVPSGGDLYLLARTLLNWDDERATVILRRCAGALGPGARLLVVEALLPEAAVSLADAFNDLNLLVLGGGRMYTEAELRTLCAQRGLQVTRVIHTPTRLSLLEAVAGNEAAAAV